jgi:hypothetical protein
MDLKETGWETMGWIRMNQERVQMAGCCERGDKHAGTIKCGLFQPLLIYGWVLKEDTE